MQVHGAEIPYLALAGADHALRIGSLPNQCNKKRGVIVLCSQDRVLLVGARKN